MTTTDTLEQGLAGALMYSEAREAGATVRRFLTENGDTLAKLGKRLRERPPVGVTTCARGSSDHAATYAKYLIENAIGIPTASAALSVTSIYDSPVAGPENTLCIAISQSGRSPDLLAAVEARRKAGALVVVLVNDIGSPLAALADVALPLMAGPELSVAATKSYIGALAGLAAIVAHWSEHDVLTEGLHRLPEQLDAAFALEWPLMPKLLHGHPSLFVIGRGYGLAIAQEAALKLKETCGLHAEGFSSAEVRHGPMAIVTAGFPVLAFATSDDAGDDVRAITAEFRRRGAEVAIADTMGGAHTLPALRALPILEPILMIQSFYRFANSLALARNLDPDVPPYLKKVTATR